MQLPHSLPPGAAVEATRTPCAYVPHTLSDCVLAPSPPPPQVSNLLARATSRSLILLDEFGKGTLSADGVGLLASLLQHYAAQPCPPLLLACTHFSELLNPGRE